MNNVRLLDLDVYVSLDSEMMNTIKERTKERYASLKLLSHDIGITRQGLSFFLGGRATMTKNLRAISDKLGISEEEIQNHVSGVYSGPYKKFRYNLGFPIELNPMHIRLASHVAGDSSLEKHHCRWYQKSLLGGQLPMNKFIGLNYSGVSYVQFNSQSTNIQRHSLFGEYPYPQGGQAC